VAVDGNDAGAVYLAAGEAVARARAGGGPTFIEAKTYRLRGHYEGDPQIYRSREEVEAWETKEPIGRWRQALLAQGIPAARLDEIDARIEDELGQAVAFAEASPLPDPADARSDLFTPLPAEI
jgi:pyruvate dehydrogenase E1 component alpha subunit